MLNEIESALLAKIETKIQAVIACHPALHRCCCLENFDLRTKTGRLAKQLDALEMAAAAAQHVDRCSVRRAKKFRIAEAAAAACGL